MSNDIVAVNDIGADTAGAITYWRVGDLSLDALTAAWGVEGLDPKLLPPEPEPEVALRRAVTAQAEKRRLVRPLARRGAWAVVDETVVGDSTHYEQIATVHFQVGAVPPIRVDRGPTVSWAAVDVVETAIRESYEVNRSRLDHSDVSVWLVRLATRVQAVSLRDSGGVYFVPRDGTDFWTKVARAVDAAAGHKVFRIPALKASEAVEAILDAITHEAESEASAIEADLAKEGDEQIGVRALKSRGDTCEAVLAKVASYERLLGVKLDTVRERIDRLSADVATARLLAESENKDAA